MHLLFPLRGGHEPDLPQLRRRAGASAEAQAPLRFRFHPMMTESDPIAPDKRQAIEARLADIEYRNDVRIVLAVESGSRAWGFPSADSDYDVRFIYARPLSSYLSFKQPRDVIEQTPGKVYDISGWDLRKAIGLAMRANATVGEWLTSPIVYRRDSRATALLLEFVRGQFSPRHYALHYLRFAQQQWKPRALTSTVKGKHYCYVVRTLLALFWTVEQKSLPPMAVDELVASVGLPYDVEIAFAELRTLKMSGAEQANQARVPTLDGWIEQSLEAAPNLCDPLPEHWPSVKAADQVFLAIIQ
jgi:predicted nucleotidyltransferase